MQIRLNRPYALNEQGRRDSSEDGIFPEKGAAAVDNRFFLVCDGVGGHEKGEVASRTVCEAFAAFLGSADLTDFDETFFDKALEYAYVWLDKADTESGERKMGTTLTFACFHSRGVFAAHIGDSRIYHLRRQGSRADILYKSGDHSIVGELIRAGVITAEEAATHPKKNVVTRVMQPNQEIPAKADVYETNDLSAGDYFFLCTDGILESVSDELLCDIAGRDIDDESKMKEIHKACLDGSHDNYSAYLIPVGGVID